MKQRLRPRRRLTSNQPPATVSVKIEVLAELIRGHTFVPLSPERKKL
jgi:hypothetical protein